jgi:hypothetical protein
MYKPDSAKNYDEWMNGGNLKIRKCVNLKLGGSLLFHFQISHFQIFKLIRFIFVQDARS